MPWKEVDAMEQRIQFIQDWLKQTHRVIDLCALYGISRKSGYKWIDRYLHDGPDWALERSHEAALVHNRTAPEVEQALMDMRLLHRTWGGVVAGDDDPGLVVGVGGESRAQSLLADLTHPLSGGLLPARGRGRAKACPAGSRRPDSHTLE